MIATVDRIMKTSRHIFFKEYHLAMLPEDGLVSRSKN